jgi:hypothetical protein
VNGGIKAFQKNLVNEGNRFLRQIRRVLTILAQAGKGFKILPQAQFFDANFEIADKVGDHFAHVVVLDKHDDTSLEPAMANQ